MFEINIKEKKFKNEIIFKNVKINFEKNDNLITLWGPSGSGKTTLLNILIGLDNDYSGEISYDGNNIKNFSNEEFSKYHTNVITCVFQDYKLFENLTVLENLKMINFNNIDEQEIFKILEELGIKKYIKEKVKNLSGGQKQRLSIARALLMNTEFIIFDEPTTGLDDINFQKFIEIINKIKKSRQIIIITHDFRLKEYSSERYYLENKGIKIQKDDQNKSINIGSKGIGNFKKVKFNLLKVTGKYKSKIFLNAMVVFLLLTVFIAISYTISNAVNTNFQYLYGGVGDNIITIKSDDFNVNAKETIPDYELTNSVAGRMYWSSQDIQKVKEIKGVQEVQTVSVESSFSNDTDGNQLNYKINVNELEKSVATANAPENIAFNFQTMPVPEEFATDYYPYPYEEKYGLIIGDYPKDGTNQIMIPDILASKYKEEEKFDELIGQKIDLNVIKEKESIQKYQISGIYKTNYMRVINENYDIFLGYRPAPIMDATKESYNLYLSDYNKLSDSGKEYYKNTFVKYTDFKEAVGTGMSTLVIKVDNYASEKEITSKLKTLFPEYNIKSQYEYREGEYQKVYQSIYYVSIIYILIISLIFSFVILILFKNYYNSRVKEMSLVQILGYRTSNMKIWLLEEILITYSVGLILFLAVFKIMNKIYVVNWIFLSAYILLNIIIVYLFIYYKIRYKKINENIK